MSCKNRHELPMDGQLSSRMIKEKSSIDQPGSSRDATNENDDTTNKSEFKRIASKRSMSLSDDDSLVDFKSPKISAKPKKSFKLLVPEKTKIKTRSSKRKNNSKKSSGSGQSTIESSFFKPTAEANASFQCPLCLKSFNDSKAKTIHSKNCAAKNHVSTKKLLEAAELQDRQAEERLSIGLPAGGFQLPRRKPANFKKLMTHDDPDVQLALALSESLHHHQQQEEFDEAIALAAESDKKVLEMTNSQRTSTLQSFGFITNKPKVEVIQKSRKRMNLGPTLLQTRDKETRDRLLCDKIAEVLIGTDRKLTQKMTDDNKIYEFDSIQLSSEILKSMYRPKKDLWKYSSAANERLHYYVEDLSPFIIPVKECENKIVESIVEKFETSMEISENILSTMKIDEKFNDDEVAAILEPKQSSPKVSNMAVESTEVIESDEKMHSCSTLVQCWRKMVNSPIYSDIIIILNDNKCIHAHKLVLWTRCEKILQEVRENTDPSHSQRCKINWDDIDFGVAFVFFEFVYCGSITDAESLQDEALIVDVKKLARKYQFEEFLGYIEQNEEQMLNTRIRRSENKPRNIQDSSKDVGKVVEGNHLIVEISEDEENHIELSKATRKSASLHNSRFSASPDPFTDMESFEVSLHESSDIVKKRSQEAPDEQAQLVQRVKSPEDSVSHGDTFHELNNTPKSSFRYSATCPKDLGSKKSQDLEVKNRVKSDLSLFIDKIKKKNTKGLLDSDSDDEIFLEPVTKRKNPFKVRKDSSFGRKYDLEKSEKDIHEEIEKKSALSMFEDKIRAKLTENKEELHHSNVAFDDSREKVANALEKYAERPVKSPKFSTFVGEMIKNVERWSESPGNTTDTNDKNTKTPSKCSPSPSKDRELSKSNEEKFETPENNSENSRKSPDFDSSFSVDTNIETDLENESMYSKYRRTHQNNSIADYRSLLKGLLKHNTDGKFESTPTNSPRSHEISAINKLRLAELSAYDIYDSPARSSSESSHNAESKSQKSLELSQRSTSSSIDRKSPPKANSFEINSLEDLDFDDWSSAEVREPLTQRVIEEKSPENNQLTESLANKFVSFGENMDSIDLTQSDNEETDCVPSQTITENVTRILKDAGILDETIPPKLMARQSNQTRIPSPIVLSSESEPASPSSGKFSPSYVFDENYENDFVLEGGAVSPPCAYYGDYSQPSTSKVTVNTQNVTFRTKKSLELPGKSTRRSYHSISSNSDDEMASTSTNIIFSQPERPSDVQKNDLRLFKCKSKSEGNFSVRKSDFHQKASESSSKKLNDMSIYNYLKLLPSQADIFEDVEPKEDYELLSSPELNKRLSDYGLRNQKRHRAIQLLDYIYDQIHPEVPEDLLSKNSNLSSQECKQSDKINSDLADEKSSSSSSSENELSEAELELSGEEYDQKEVQEVQQCFQKLLDEDRELHNRVLTYEPLGLENLYEKLKKKGVKGGIKVLADYLDDECIAFFIEFPKKRGHKPSGGRKKRKIK